MAGAPDDRYSGAIPRAKNKPAQLLVAQSLTAVGRYEDTAQALRDYLKNHPKDAGRPKRGSGWTVWRQMKDPAQLGLSGAQRSGCVCQ